MFKIISVIGGSAEAEEGPRYIIDGLAGAIEGIADIVGTGVLIITGARGAPSNLGNTRNSNSWTEGIASGDEGGVIGSVGPLGS